MIFFPPGTPTNFLHVLDNAAECFEATIEEKND